MYDTELLEDLRGALCGAHEVVDQAIKRITDLESGEDRMALERRIKQLIDKNLQLGETITTKNAEFQTLIMDTKTLTQKAKDMIFVYQLEPKAGPLYEISRLSKAVLTWEGKYAK